MSGYSASSTQPAQSWGATAAGVFIAAAMPVLMGVQPILLGLYLDHLHLALSQGGWLLAAEQGGAAAGALIGYWLATRASWSYSIVAGAMLAAAVNLATAFAGGFTELVLLRFTSGAATTIAYTVAIYFLGHIATPDRTFGFVMMLQTAFISAGAFALAKLAVNFGYFTAIASGAAWFVAAMFATAWLPKNTTRLCANAPLPNQQHRNRLLASAGLVGSFLLQLSVFAVWGFLERVGRRDGLSNTLVDNAIGIAVLGGILGGLLPAVIGARFGRIFMIAVATVLLVVSYAGLSRETNWVSYVGWVTALNVGWVLGLTYYMGLAVRHDPDGRFTRLLPFAQVLGTAAGPVCSALVTGNDRLWPVFWVASLAAVAGLAIALASATRARLATCRVAA